MAEERIVISDEEETGPEISANGSPLNSVNSMNSAAPMEIGNHNGPQAEQIRRETIGSVYAYAYATEEAAIVQGSSSSSGLGFQHTALPSRQSSVMILGEFEQGRTARQEPVITVGDTWPAAQSNEAIYLSDSTPSTPESINSAPDEQSISNVFQNEHRNSISLVGYTENVIPQSLITQFGDDERNAGNQSSVSAQATSPNCNGITETNLQPPVGTGTFQAQGYTQATTAAQTPSVGGSSSTIECTLTPLQLTTVNKQVTSRSMPITVESPPSAVHVHPTTMSCSANRGSGSTIQSSVAGVSTHTVGSNSESTPQPTVSQTQLIPVNANVLEQVVKLAAFGWERLNPDNGSRQQHVVDLYRLLTNTEASLSESALLVLGATSGMCMQGNEREPHSSSSGGTDISHATDDDDDDVIYVPNDPQYSTSSQQAAVQQAVSSEPIIIDQSPEKSDTHNGATPLQANVHQPSTSTPTAVSNIEELISLTTESNQINESSFNSTLTEVTLEDSFDDECPTPIQQQSKLLKREISNESTRSEKSAPPRKRPKMTLNRRAQSSLTSNREGGSREGVTITESASPGRDSHITVSIYPSPSTPHPQKILDPQKLILILRT